MYLLFDAMLEFYNYGFTVLYIQNIKDKLCLGHTYVNKFFKETNGLDTHDNLEF